MSRAKKCIIWGIGNGYEELLNQLLFERYKGNISIEALVCREQDRYCFTRDGFPVITKDELEIGTFEYIIITAYTRFHEIRNEILELGVASNQIINGTRLRLPFFDFQRYAKIIENPVTILSDDCWGGYVYHNLGLPFSTPLINILFKREEYAKFILDPIFYLNTELTMVREGNIREGIYPVGQLGDKNRNIKLELVHNSDFNNAKIQWDRRKKRIDPENMFLKMGLEISEKNKDLYLDSFSKAPVRNKILFYFGKEEIDDAFKTERFIWYMSRNAKGLNNSVDTFDYNDYVKTFSYNDYMRENYLLEMDILKMLTNSKDYSRY